MQADFTRDYMTALFSHPSCAAFLVWGFWQGSHWKGDCAMLRKDWTEKPNLKAYEELVLKKWWTDIKGNTDEKGILKVRGFLGDYEITVTKDGKTKSEKATLGKNGAKLNFRM